MPSHVSSEGGGVVPSHISSEGRSGVVRKLPLRLAFRAREGGGGGVPSGWCG